MPLSYLKVDCSKGGGMPSRYDTDTAYLYYTEGGAYRVSGPEFARCINKLNASKEVMMDINIFITGDSLI